MTDSLGRNRSWRTRLYPVFIHTLHQMKQIEVGKMPAVSLMFFIIIVACRGCAASKDLSTAMLTGIGTLAGYTAGVPATLPKL